MPSAKTQGATADSGSAPLAVLNEDVQAPLHPAFFTDSYLSQSGPALRPEERGDAWLTTLKWGGQVGKKPIQYRFQANWVKRRGVGSCYVLLPSLSANGLLPGQQSAVCALAQRSGERLDCGGAEVTELLSHAEPPSSGRTVLTMDGGVLEEGTPDPNDYESVWRPGPELEGHDDRLLDASQEGPGRHSAPVWVCLPSQDLSYLPPRSEHFGIPSAGSFSGNACGALAVVEPPNADEIRTTIVVIASVLLGIAAERFFEGLFRRRRRRNTGGETGPSLG